MTPLDLLPELSTMLEPIRACPPLRLMGRLVLALAALSSSPLRAGTEGEAFRACEEAFAAEPRGSHTCRCFHDEAKRARRLHQGAHRLAAHLEGDPDNPCLQFYLGLLKVTLGQSPARDLLTAAAEGYGSRGDVIGEVYARINLSRLFAKEGHLEAALDQVGAALAALGSSDDPILRAQMELEQARLWMRQGEDLERIDRRLRGVEAKVFPGGHLSLQRDTLLELGNVRRLRGRLSQAESFFRRMIEVTRGAGDAYGESTARLSLAGTHIARLPRSGAREEAIALLRGAIDSASASGHRSNEARARRMLGKLLGGDEGRRELERSVFLARRLRDPAFVSRCLGGLAAELVEESPVEARKRIDEVRGLLPSLLPAERFYGWIDRMTVDWATRPRQEAVQNALSELREIEGLRRRQRSGTGRAESFAVRTEAYYWLSGRLLEAAEAGGRPDRERAFSVTERMRARVLLDALAPPPARPDFATLTEVEEALEKNEALLSFQVALWEDIYGDFAGGSWLLASTRDGTRAYRLPDRVRLEPAIRVFRNLFSRRDGFDRGPAASLFDDLLTEALADLPAAIDRLVIIPDGHLHLLPFGALRPRVSSAPLAARYQVSVVPSATLWLRWRQAAPAPAPRLALALADPALAGDGVRDALLDPLPYARHEGRAVVRFLGKPSELLVGDGASESALKSMAARRLGVVHFAAHALVGGEDPRRSAVVLAPGSDAEDGLLQPREIARLDLEGALVVLSTCQSASGNALAGEGPLSLARAFFQAGARAVVASLWRLRDDEAAALFEPFYRHLGRGASVAGALGAAQQERIAGGAPSAAWAGVVVLGDGSLVPLPGGRSRAVPGRWPLALAGLAAILVGARRALLRRPPAPGLRAER